MTPHLTAVERVATLRVTLDLMSVAAGRPDLSRNLVDHDDWCAKTIDIEVVCSCTASPLFGDGANSFLARDPDGR